MPARCILRRTDRFRDSLEGCLSTWVICPSFNRIFSHSQLHSQIPRERQSSRLPHLLIPPQSFVQLQDARSPSPVTRDHPRCISGEFRRTRPFQDARGERIRWTQATSKRRVEPLRSAESCVGLADGVLHGSSKGFRLVDGRSTSNECDTFRPDVEIRHTRVDSASRDGTGRNTSNYFHNLQLCRVFLDGLSLSTFWKTFGRGNRWSTPTNF